MSHSKNNFPSLKFAQSISTIAAKGEDMFAKLQAKKSKLFKSLTGAFCCSDRKRCAKEGAAADFGETRKTEEAMGSNKPKSEITIS